MADVDLSSGSRWELYRVLSEPLRLRLLALAAEEELSIGELAELLGEGQPNVSRHAAALRQAGLLADRREGTRTLVRLPSEATRDAVVADALASGRSLCEKDGSLARVATVVEAREAASREFFSRPGKPRIDALPAEMGAYLAALAPLLPRRGLALDAGTGDGRLLDVLAPVYDRVVAFDRSEAQLARARERVASRGYENVTLVAGELDSKELRKAVGSAGADAVFASRVLHHAPQPSRAVAQLTALCAPGGALVVLDYAKHEDESMRDQADVWLGFDPAELRRFARAAGLEDARVTKIPPPYRGDGPDRHLPWQVLIASKGQRHHG
ncbi:MAG TPA: metalloregulator ArsR/SmtB family transcription factor [Polyangiaceae bacterium]|nr:metalloregulator ArsR/SmtB family transcription factor [Polyangiaceae bacterium]